jgi:hypothetical protein
MASRKKTVKLREQLGSDTLLCWGNRAVEVEGSTLLMGFYSKVVNELFTPRSILFNMIDKAENRIITAA